MKLIPLREFPGLKSIEIIKAVIERPGPQGATIAAVRAGCRVLDALERNVGPNGLALEDADHAVLVTALNGFTFGMVSKELLTIVDDVINAPAQPAPPLPLDRTENPAA